jgi:hypothetical protein
MSYEISPLFEQLRSTALAFKDSNAPTGDLYGVVMETGLAGGVATLIALGDGTISLYFTNGNAFLGSGERDGPTRSAHRFATTAMRLLESIPASPDASLAREGETKFFVLIDGGVRSAAGATVDLGEGRHKLAPLFRAGHALLAEVRQHHPEG